MVSNNEPEVALSDISGLLNHIRRRPVDPTTAIHPTLSADNTPLVSNLNTISPATVGGSTNVDNSVTSQSINWKWFVVGNVEPGTSASSPAANLAKIDYQSL